MKTIDADTGTVDSTPTNQLPRVPQVASIINIPPQLSTTLVWVGIGFALGVWLMWSKTTTKGNG